METFVFTVFLFYESRVDFQRNISSLFYEGKCQCRNCIGLQECLLVSNFFFPGLSEFSANVKREKEREREKGKIKERASYVAKIARKTAARSFGDLSLELHEAKHEFPIVQR